MKEHKENSAALLAEAESADSPALNTGGSPVDSSSHSEFRQNGKQGVT